MKNYKISDIEEIIKSEDYLLQGNKNALINNISPVDNAKEASLVWCSEKQENKKSIIENTKANIIICDKEVQIDKKILKNKCLIRTNSPKFLYGRVVNNLFKNKKEYNIHETAVIHPEAEISKNVYIGPNTYIGKCKIEEACVIDGNSYVYDDVIINKNVYIEAGCIIGADGYGFSKCPDGSWERFPHIGKLIIEENVEIGANSYFDKGSLGDTIIGKGTKISKSVHVSHNVEIGKNCIITGNVLISGSAIIGDNVWIGPKSAILNKIKIDNNVTIGIGSVVSKDVKEGFKAIGNRIIPDKI